MTNDELNDIVSAARARQPDITQGEWSFFFTPWGKYAGISNDFRDVVNISEDKLIINGHDADLITAAPNLNAAVIELWERLQMCEANNHPLRVISPEGDVINIKSVSEGILTLELDADHTVILYQIPPDSDAREVD